MTKPKQAYRVIKGITYDRDRKRGEPGDVLDDLPLGSLAWLQEQGYIVPVLSEEQPADTGED